MSLQVWLTGNNSMNNQGLLGELTQTTVPTYVDGKLGKAMSTGAYKMTAEQTAQVLNNEAISICFWVYINANTGTTDNRAMFFGNDDMGSNNNRKFSLFNYPTVNDFHWSWMNNTGNNIFTSGVLSGVLPSYKWTHVAITYQNPNGTVYINGEKAETFTGVSNSSTFAYETQVIHNGSYLKRNDFRIYDHCLSAKEVKDISKGLVCHYQLKSQYETGQVNKYSGDVAEGSLSTNGAFTKTKLEGERGYNYKFSYTGNGNDRWDSIDAGYFSFTIGKRYYYSCKVRCHSKNFNMQLRASRSNNDWVTNMTNVLNPDGEWHEYVVSQTINSTYDRSGSTVTCNPILEFYTDDLVTSGKVYSADFDIKDIQVIESDCYVPFIDNDMVSNVVSDCSGYGNNGTKVGDIAWKNDSPRYSGSYYFPKSASRYIYRDSRFGFLKNLTFSCWINQMDRVTVHGTGEIGVQFVMSQGRDYRENANLSFGFNIIIVNGYVYIVSLNTYANTGYQLDLNKWYHICQTFDGSYIKVYVNGECIYTIADNTTDLWNNDGNAFVIGKMSTGYTSDDYYFPFVGKISDARVYATALSEEDVKALYNVSASIDKTGVLSAYEFVEEGEYEC